MELNDSKRQSLIALVHIAKSKARVCSKCGLIAFGTDTCPKCGKKLCFMPDFWYRSILQSATGSDSCSFMESDDLEKVMDVFNEAGFRKAFPYISPRAEQAKQNAAVRRNIRFRAEQVLGDNWQARVNGFVKSKMGKNSLSFCNAMELRKVIGWINATDRNRKEEKA